MLIWHDYHKSLYAWYYMMIYDAHSRGKHQWHPRCEPRVAKEAKIWKKSAALFWKRFLQKKNIVFLILNPRPRLFLRGALLFEYLKHEKARVWFGQDKRVCYIQAFDFARYKTAPANVRRHTVDVDGRQIIGEVIPHTKHSLDALARSMSAIGWFTASWRKGLVFLVE